MRTLSLVILFALTACGGGGGGGAEAESAQASVVVGGVIAFGDSTQAGLTPPNTYTPPANEAARLLGRADIRQDGRTGTTSLELLDGTDGSGMYWVDRIAPATIVTINHGLNEIGRSPADYRTTLRQLVFTAQAAGKRVVLETPNPMVPAVPALDGLAQVVRDVALETGATLCDQHTAIIAAGLNTVTYIPDGVHPSPALYLFKGQVLADCLRPLL